MEQDIDPSILDFFNSDSPLTGAIINDPFYTVEDTTFTHMSDRVENKHERLNSFLDEFISIEILEDFIEEYKDEIKFPSVKEFKKNGDRTKHFWEISDYNGDDKISISNFPLWGVFSAFIDVKILKVCVSWKDTGISKNFANYSEEWILTPLNSATHPSFMTDMEKENVPFIMDQPKLKWICPAKKQSKSKLESQIENRYKQICKAVNWTHKKALTYNMMELTKLLGLTTLGIRKARLSPLLFDHEGGCGGAPPWNNQRTAYTMLYWIRGGTTAHSTLNIMAEAQRLLRGETRPSECKYILAPYLAQLSKSRFENYLNLFRNEAIKNFDNWCDYDIATENMKIDHEQLATHCQPISFDDFTEGPLIAALRKKGIIMTDTDVNVLLDEREQNDALLGTVPIGELVVEKDKKKTYQRYQWFLDQCETHNITLNDGERWDSLKNWRYSHVINVLDGYYKAKMNYWESFSTFFYTETANIYIRRNVMDVLDKPRYDDLMESIIGIKPFHAPRGVYVPDPLKVLSENSAIMYLYNLMFNKKNFLEIPPEIIADDVRIIHNVRRLVFHERLISKVFLLITSDTDLTAVIKAFLEQHKSIHTFLYLTIGDYLAEIISPKPKSLKPKLQIYSIIERCKKPISVRLNTFLLKYATDLSNVIIEYDRPNIKRKLRYFNLESLILGKLYRTPVKTGFSTQLLDEQKRKLNRSIFTLEFEDLRKILNRTKTEHSIKVSESYIARLNVYINKK